MQEYNINFFLNMNENPKNYKIFKFYKLSTMFIDKKY